jgi:hypothetical protein
MLWSLTAMRCGHVIAKSLRCARTQGKQKRQADACFLNTLNPKVRPNIAVTYANERYKRTSQPSSQIV